MSRRNPCKFEIRGHCLNGRRCHYSHNYFEWPPHALLVRQNFMLNKILKSMDKSIDTLSEISGAAELDRTEEYALGIVGVLESYIGSINNITKQSACVAMSKLLIEINSDDIKKLRDNEEPNSPKIRVYNTVISYIESNRKKQQANHPSAQTITSRRAEEDNKEHIRYPQKHNHKQPKRVNRK